MFMIFCEFNSQRCCLKRCGRNEKLCYNFLVVKPHPATEGVHIQRQLHLFFPYWQVQFLTIFVNGQTERTTTTSLGLLSHKSRKKPGSWNCRVFVLVHILNMLASFCLLALQRMQILISRCKNVLFFLLKLVAMFIFIFYIVCVFLFFSHNLILPNCMINFLNIFPDEYVRCMITYIIYY